MRITQIMSGLLLGENNSTAEKTTAAVDTVTEVYQVITVLNKLKYFLQQLHSFNRTCLSIV